MAMFQQRHFETVARIMRSALDDAQSLEPAASAYPRISQTREIAQRFATMFKHDNERFDRDRFLKACGVIEVG